ncbi:MAG: hypothetical protein LW711_05295, partial [Saprospiraceae bacterium]|nr:hypothetical protein [Saprospiraceae bacterium]
IKYVIYKYHFYGVNPLVRLRITTIDYKAFPFTLTVIDVNDKNPIYFDEEILTKHCMTGMIDFC